MSFGRLAHAHALGAFFVMAFASFTHANDADDQCILLQASKLSTSQGKVVLLQHSHPVIASDAPLLHIDAYAEASPMSLAHTSQALIRAARYGYDIVPSTSSSLQLGAVILALVLLISGLRFMFPGSDSLRAMSLGSLYIVCSAMVIESNKWLMQPDNFPYPVALTTNHMFMSLLLARCLRYIYPSGFSALEKVEVTPWFLLKFVPMGAAFSLSIVCGNGAYKYMSVSFLQCMKQWNIVIIYFLSVLASLEALRRCSILLLVFTLCGTLIAIHGEMHFRMVGFVLQVISSLSEATKVIMQSILMSGSFKLDPLTMVLFMAPACLLANIIPLTVLELTQWSELHAKFILHFPFILFNASLAFALNVIVAQCIKQLSPVGYLLCGVVKDVSIIVTSSIFLGESLATMQMIGFCVALCGVASYSLYKQNMDCFDDDSLINGFARVVARLSAKYNDAEPTTALK